MKQNFNTQSTFESDEAFIAHMKEVVSSVQPSENVLVSILKKTSTASVAVKNHNSFLWSMYLSRTWRVVVPAVLALVLIVGGVTYERNTVAPEVAMGNGNTSVTAPDGNAQTLSDPDDVSDAALDNDLAVVDDQLAALGDDTDSADSALMAN